MADLVDNATSNDLRQPDMTTNNAIKDEINSNGEVGKTAAFQIRKRLQTNQPKVMFLALGLLDMLMDKCGTQFH